MEKLKSVIDQYGRWSTLSTYVERIEAHIISDYSVSLGNAKELLETVGREICSCKGETLTNSSSVNGIIKKAFSALGYTSSESVSQISSALATIAQQVGELRNEVSGSGHGGTLEELEERNNNIDALTREILIDSVEIVSCLLIKAFEIENPRVLRNESEAVNFDEAEGFNEYWDDIYGEFEMGDYSYSASEILYNVDVEAYMNEYKGYKEDQKILS